MTKQETEHERGIKRGDRPCNFSKQAARKISHRHLCQVPKHISPSMHIILRSRTVQGLCGDPMGETHIGAMPWVYQPWAPLLLKFFPAFPCSPMLQRDLPLHQAASHPVSSAGFQLDLANRNTERSLGGRRREKSEQFPHSLPVCLKQHLQLKLCFFPDPSSHWTSSYG